MSNKGEIAEWELDNIVDCGVHSMEADLEAYGINLLPNDKETLTSEVQETFLRVLKSIGVKIDERV